MDLELEDFITACRFAQAPDTLFVVEGKNDVRALEAIDIEPVWELDTELYLFVEKVAERFDKVVLLTDLDSEGKRLYKLLKSHCARFGLKVLDAPREALFTTKISQVEGLSNIFSHTQ